MGRPRYDLSSIILVKSPTEYYRESDAILRISQGLDELPFRLLGFAGLGVPRLLRDQVYHVVANNRYRFGETDQCRLDLDGEYDGRFVADPFVEEKKE
jgi:predicted DCC family thiol-disulfide oxidoreductase YuxK